MKKKFIYCFILLNMIFFVNLLSQKDCNYGIIAEKYQKLKIQNRASVNPEKIRMYSICTNSHKILRDKYFLPSIKDDYEVIIKEYNQTVDDTGTYGTISFIKTVFNKIEVILEAIQNNWQKYFIFSDVDIQFFTELQPIISRLIVNKDLLVQRALPYGNYTFPCTGFIVCRANEKTLNFWQHVKRVMQDREEWADQDAFNFLILGQNEKFNLLWDYLPAEFFSPGPKVYSENFRWHPGDAIDLPKNIVLHHANWTIGIENKISQFDYVKNIIAKLKS